MSQIERTIQVNFALKVFFTRGVFDPGNPLLNHVVNGENRGASVLVVLDDSLATAQSGLAGRICDYFAGFRSVGAKLVCPPVLIEGGERVKNSSLHVTHIHSQIERHHIDRHSYLIAVGGGALLDAAGLAAATAHRGVRHVRIPSTTLSQADSGVGVKNGINAFGKKNFIGTFSPPYAVINDFELLNSLSLRDKRAGFSEAVKVALIRDAPFFCELEAKADLLAQFEPAAVEWLIRHCAECHLDHIAHSGDPFEFGSARPLDFGHWAAHKLEQLSDYKIRHGEAVAVGIAMDVVYSRLMGFIERATEERVLTLLECLGFDLFASELLHENSEHTPLLLSGITEFREHLGGKLAITLLREIGRGFEVDEIHAPKVMEAVGLLKKRHEERSRIVRPSELSNR